MHAERAVLGSWCGAALGVAGLLVPKCPLCLAAYLCLFGVSASSAQAMTRLGLPLCLGLVIASALGTALLVAHRARGRARAQTPQRSDAPRTGAGCCQAR